LICGILERGRAWAQDFQTTSLRSPPLYSAPGSEINRLCALMSQALVAKVVTAALITATLVTAEFVTRVTQCRLDVS